MTVLLYARRKGWPVRSVTVECRHSRVHRRVSEEPEHRRAYTEVIHHRVRIEGDLTDEQAARIGEISRRCPVRRMLESSPEIVDEFDLVRLRLVALAVLGGAVGTLGLGGAWERVALARRGYEAGVADHPLRRPDAAPPD